VILKYLYYKFWLIVFLRNAIKKHIPITSKIYIFLLFLKSRNIEYFKILAELIYNELFNKKKKVILQINKKKISFAKNNFYTTSYFLYKSIIPEKPVLIFLYNYFNKKTGIFIDVGGFVGLHSFIVKTSNAMSKVYMIEADKYKCQILKENITNNNFKNIYIENKFITGSSGNKNPNDYTKYTDNNISLNNFILKKNISKIDIVKMDIEGLEFHALQNLNFKKIKILLLEFHVKIIKNELKKDPYEIIKILKKNYNLFYLNSADQTNSSIKNFEKKILKEKENIFLVCSNLKIENLRKFLDNKINIERMI
jgi:FkbM family methyltransferase